MLTPAIQIRDLLSLRNIQTMENMTVRAIKDARTVKSIAVVTLLFLPPALTTVSIYPACDPNVS